MVFHSHGEIGEIIEKMVRLVRYTPNRVFPERASKLLDFKSQVPDFKVLIKTCIAFANGAGGRIIIGVEESTREIIGVSETDLWRIYADFPHSLYEATAPEIA